MEQVEQRAPVVQPHMGRVPAWAGGGLVAVGGVGWGGAAVAHDEGRAVAAPAKGDTGDVELQGGVLVQLQACGLALGAVFVKFGLGREHRPTESAKCWAQWVLR